jgi:hypothetical protein
MTSICEIFCVGRSLGEEQGSGRYALFGQNTFCLFGVCSTTVAISRLIPCPALLARYTLRVRAFQTQAIAVQNSFPALLSLLSIGL